MKYIWPIKRLSEVCETGAGGTPLKSHKEYYNEGTIPWLLSGEVSQGELFKANNFITNIGLKNSSARLFPENTVLIAMYGATAGQVGILRFESATNQAVCGILPNEKLLPEFIYYFFLSKKDELIAQAVGGAQPNISQIKIKNTLIPLPHLSEQKRIVAILDQAFAAIDQAKANAEKNLANVRELWESYLLGVFTNPGEGWVERRLGEVCEKITDGSHFSPKSSNDDVYPYVTVRDIQDDNIDFDNCKFISKSNYELLYKNGCKPNSGDLLFSKDGTVGKVSLVNFDKEFVVLSSLAIIRPKKNMIDSNLLKYILKNPEFLNIAIGMKTGVAIRRIILKNLKIINICFPKSILAQQKIVAELDALSAETKRLVSIYQQKIVDLDELKKSILDRAFKGEI